MAMSGHSVKSVVRSDSFRGESVSSDTGCDRRTRDMATHSAAFSSRSGHRTLWGYGAFVGLAAAGGGVGWLVRADAGLFVGVVIGLVVAVAVWTLMRPATEATHDSQLEAKPFGLDSAADISLTESSLNEHGTRSGVAHASRSARTHRTGDL